LAGELVILPGTGVVLMSWPITVQFCRSLPAPSQQRMAPSDEQYRVWFGWLESPLSFASRHALPAPKLPYFWTCAAVHPLPSLSTFGLASAEVATTAADRKTNVTKTRIA
jgi:hypothetical protein